MSWTRPSHLGGSGLTPGQNTKTVPATRVRRKGRKIFFKKRKKDGKDPRTNGKRKPIKTKSHKEAYTYTLTKREKGKNNLYI